MIFKVKMLVILRQKWSKKRDLAEYNNINKQKYGEHMHYNPLNVPKKLRLSKV